MDREFDDILNECIEAVAGGEDIDRCAARYPEHARELASLLRVATATTQVAAAASYTADAKARGLNRLSQAVADREARPARRFSVFPRAVPRPLLLGFMAIVLVVVGAGWTTVASSNSVPGDPLYWVKTTRESIDLRLPRSDNGKAQIHARLASVRGEEMRKLIVRGRVEDAKVLVVRIRIHLGRSAHYTGVVVPVNPIEMPVAPVRLPTSRSTRELRASLERDGQALRNQLSELMRNLPSRHRDLVQQALRQSDLGYRMLIDALQDQSTRGQTFWRVEPPGLKGRSR